MKRIGLVGWALLAACAPGGTTSEPGEDTVDTVPPDDTACTPGAGSCNGEFARRCRDDGTGWDTQYCDPLLGLACNEATGACTGSCAPQNLGQNYMGCEYYPTVTGNEVISVFDFAVVVSNTTSNTAHVTIAWGGLTEPVQFDVLPGAVQIGRLPWIHDLKGCMGETGISCAGERVPTSTLHPKGAYHLRSTQPITVYQFSPLDYQLAGEETWSYTNDASLLFPVNAMGLEYVVAAWNFHAPESSETGSPGLLAITATADDTHVTIRPTADAEAALGAPELRVGVDQDVTLQQGDVVEFFNFTGDFTGTHVTADKPVQVIGGHYCTYIPDELGYCDHLEESIFPVLSLGREYAVAPPAMHTLPDGKVRYVRIIAVSDDTTVTYDPPQSISTHIARAGEFIEVPDTDATFVIRATKKVLVAQYMEGQEVAGAMGDPAMALAVPTDQYRLSYLFHAPTNYEENYVEVFGPTTTEVVLDGAPIGALTAIGGSGIGHRLVQLDAGPRDDGSHEIHATAPFGISVYGYGQYTSYWYPGGLDLEPVIFE